MKEQFTVVRNDSSKPQNQIKTFMAIDQCTYIFVW